MAEAATVRKVLVISFNTSSNEKDMQLTISKPKFNLDKTELGAQMDKMIATGVLTKYEYDITTKKAAVYKTTTTDEIVLGE